MSFPFDKQFPLADPRLFEPFDPIKPATQPGTGLAGSRLTSISGGEGEAIDQNPTNLDALLNQLRGMNTTAPQGEVEWGDYAKTFGAGAAGLGGALVGAAEYGLNQLPEGETRDLTRGLREGLGQARRDIGDYAQGVVQSMTPEAQARIAREFTTLDPNKTIWQGGADEFISSLMLKVTEAAPSTLATLVPGALMLRAGMGAGGIAYLGASEGGISMGQIANNIATEIEQADEAELMTAPRYAELRNTMGEAEARQALIREAQGATPLIAGTIVGSISALAGRYLEPVLVPEGGAGLLTRFGRGFVAEGPFQEAPQSATEQLAQNIAAQIYDTGRSTYEGVGEAAVQGTAVGGLMGGGVTAALGRRPTPPQAGAVGGATETPPPVDPDIAAAVQASQERPQHPEYVDPYSGQMDMFPPAGQWDIDPRDQPAPSGMSPQQEQASYLQRPWPVQQGELALEPEPQAPAGPGVLVPGEPQQMPLGLRGPRQRGVGRQVIEPTPSTLAEEPGEAPRPGDYLPPNRRPTIRDFEMAVRRAEMQAGRPQDPDQLDLFEPPDDGDGGGPGAPTPAPTPRTTEGYAVRARDAQGNVVQEDLFATREEAAEVVDRWRDENPDLFVTSDVVYNTAAQQPASTVPDEPSAEPLSDLRAQMEDLADPDSPRLGVYLSRDNVRMLRKQRSYEQMRGTGIPLGNFDGKGGVLIAKNQQVAEELTSLRDQGTDMQELLGLATGAGTGKPEGGLVVQLRDDSGNVTRESLVASPQQADELVARWEAETGQEAIVLTSPAAIGRRQRKLRAESAQAFQRNRARQVRGEVEGAVPADFEGRDDLIERAGKRRSTEEAGIDLLEEAGEREAAARGRAIEGVKRPNDLKFADGETRERYRALYNAFVDASTKMELAEVPAVRMEAEREVATAKRRIAAFLRLNPSSTRGTRELAGAAKRLGVRAANIEQGAEPAETGEDAIGDIEEMSEEQVRKLGDEDLDVEFVRAVNYGTGREASRKADEKRKTKSVKELIEQGGRAEAAADEDTVSDEERARESEGLRVLIPAGATFEQMVERYPTRSERRKFVSQMQRLVRSRRYGYGKIKKNAGTEVTKTAETKRAPIGSVAILSEQQINKLDAAGVNREFRKAALYQIGRKEKTSLVDAPLTAMMREHPTIADRRDFLKRFHSKFRNDGVTRATLSLPIAKRKGKFDTTVLLQTEPTKDEQEASESERRKRVARQQAALKKLTGALAKTDKTMESLAGPEGIFARAYLQSLHAFGRGLLQAKPQHFKGIEQIEILAKTLNEIAGEKAGKQIQSLTQLMQADERANVALAARMDPKRLSSLNNPRQRMDLLANSVTNLQERLARLYRLENIWGKDPYFRSSVQPVLRKIVEAVGGTYTYSGGPSPAPTENEMKGLRFAMRLLRKRQAENEDAYQKIRDARIKNKVPITEAEERFYQQRLSDYDLLRRTLRDAGVRFNDKGDVVIPVNEQGQYDYSNETELSAKWRRRFGKNAEPRTTLTGMPGSEYSAEAFNRERARVKERIEAGKDRDAITPEGLTKLGRINAVNRAIMALRRAVASPRSSTLDIIAAERRLVDTLKAGEMWKPTGFGGQLGRITLPNKSFTVRLVGPRLQKGDLTVAEARQAMLDLYKPVPLTPEMAASPEVRAAGARTFTELNRNRTETYSKEERQRLLAMTPEQRKVAEAYKRRDRSNKKLRAIDVKLRDEQFTEAGRRLQDLFDTQESVSMNQALETMWRDVPKGTVVHEVVERILNMNLDYNVEWHPGSVFSDADTKADFDIADGIRLNRDFYDRMRSKGQDPAADLFHTLLHESVHAATQEAIQANPLLRDAVQRMVNDVRQYLEATGQKLPYGVTAAGQADVAVFEFVAEAFSNPDFQSLLQSIKPTAGRTVWQRFVDMVKRIFGISYEQSEQGDVLESIMDMADTLFKQPGVRTQSVRRLAMRGDAAAHIAADVIDRVRQGKQVRDVMGRTAEAGLRTSSALLSALTMEQIHNFYQPHFNDPSVDSSVRLAERNPLAAYWRAFSERGAESSALMERADKLSRRWTGLTEKAMDDKATEGDPAEASRIMTEATIYGVHPDLPLVARENQHVQLDNNLSLRHTQLMRALDKLGPEWKSLYTDVRKFYQETLERETELATLNALRAYMTSGKNPPYTHEEFQRRFPEGSVKKLKLNTKSGLRDAFREEFLPDSALKNVLRLSSIPSLYKGPYFPLSRFGDYAVYAKRVVDTKQFATREEAVAEGQRVRSQDPTLSTHVAQMEGERGWTLETEESEFRLAETMTEAQQNEKEMVAKYGRDNTTSVQLRAKMYSSDSAISGERGLRSILDKLGDNNAAKAAIKDFYLRALGENSFRKHEARRKGVRGVDPAVQHRAFQAYASAASYFTAQLRHGWRMADAKRHMEGVARRHTDTDEISALRMGQVVKEIKLRDEMTTSPQELSDIVRRGTEISHFMLLTSPSYWMINASQPWLVGLPWLAARSSLPEAAAALKNAQKMIIAPLVEEGISSWGGFKALKSKVAAEKAFTVLEKLIDPENGTFVQKLGKEGAKPYIDLLTQLRRQGIIDLSFVAEIRSGAEGLDTSTTQRVLDAARIMAHLTEVNNRIMTAVAAYDLSKAKGLDSVAATEFAAQAVSKTQFNYSAGNKPRLFQQGGPLGRYAPLAFQFMQYPQHMYALMAGEYKRAVEIGTITNNEALKTLTGLVLSHVAVGGMIGAMLQPAKWALGMIFAMFSDDDDRVQDILSGETFDRHLRETAADVFGTEMGLLLSKGIPASLGADLSSRMSLGTLYFIDMKPETAESFWGSMVMSFGGPWPSLLSGGARGVNHMLEGDVMRGLEYFLPKGGKDFLRFARYAQDGLSTMDGNTIIDAKDMSPGGLFLQSLGFTPTQVTEAYEARAAIRTAEDQDDAERGLLIRKFTQANTPEERADARENIREYNRSAPVSPITMSSLLRSRAQSRARDRNVRRYGADLRGRRRAYAEEAEPYLFEAEE